MTDPFPGYEGIAVLQGGRLRQFPLRTSGRKSKFHFAWGRPGRRSGVWHVIAEKKGDVYVLEQTMAADIKVSLHKERWWNLSYIKNNGVLTPAGELWQEVNGSHHIHQRQRPEIDGPILHGIKVFVTSHDIQDWPFETETDDSIEWFDPPGEGEVSYVMISFSEPYPEQIEINQQVLNICGMANGQAVMTTLAYQVLDAAENRVMEAMRADLVTSVTPQQTGDLPARFRTEIGPLHHGRRERTRCLGRCHDRGCTSR